MLANSTWPSLPLPPNPLERSLEALTKHCDCLTGTQDPQAVRFVLDGRIILLIDTSGFDDDNRSDVQILEDIARWLAKEGYMKKSGQLDGLIFLHPVTMHRVGGSERKRTRLLQNLLGEKAYKRIIIATTMWERIKDENDVEIGLEGRKKDMWHDLISKGTKIRKHYNSKDSAHAIIREIVSLSEKYGKLEPLISTELKRDPRLVETTAGKSVKKDLVADIKRTQELLEELDKNRPNKKEKKKEWADEKKTLDKRLKRLEDRLDKLNSLQVSCQP